MHATSRARCAGAPRRGEARARLMRRSPLEDVYSSAHCMYAALVVSTPSSCATCTANALSGSTCAAPRAPQQRRTHVSGSGTAF